MRYRHTSTRRLATAVVATFVIGVGGLSAGFTQEPADQAESWRDQIGPNDEQVTGIVGAVHEDSFELQSHGTLYFFDKPSDAAQRAHVRTGTEVQVFFDPSGYQRDGNSYHRTSVIARTGESTDPQTASRAGVDSDSEATELQSRTSTQADQAQVSSDARSTAVSDDSQQDRSQLSQNENPNRYDESAARVQTDQDESSDLDRRMGDERTLPQTAGVLPLVGLMGLLGLLGAVALRIFRS